MTYNLTNFTSANSISDLVRFGNSITEPTPVVGLLMISLFFIMIFMFKKETFSSSLLTASFICFVLSALLAFGGMLSLYYALMFLVVTAFTYMYIAFTGQ